MTRVQFIKPWRMYQTGETAAFEADVADQLITAVVAVDAEAAEAEAKAKADAEAAEAEAKAKADAEAAEARTGDGKRQK
jgi:hypothetical protein